MLKFKTFCRIYRSYRYIYSRPIDQWVINGSSYRSYRCMVVYDDPLIQISSSSLPPAKVKDGPPKFPEFFSSCPMDQWIWIPGGWKLGRFLKSPFGARKKWAHWRILVGGLEHDWIIFHFIYWDVIRNPLTNSIIFQDGHIAPPENDWNVLILEVLNSCHPT